MSMNMMSTSFDILSLTNVLQGRSRYDDVALLVNHRHNQPEYRRLHTLNFTHAYIQLSLISNIYIKLLKAI